MIECFKRLKSFLFIIFGWLYLISLPASAHEKTIIAVVNGKALYMEDLEVEIGFLDPMFRKGGIKNNALKKKALDRLIEMEILSQEAPFLVDTEGIEKEVLREMNKLKKGLERYDHALRERIKKGLLIKRYVDEIVMKSIKVDEEEVKKFYEKNKDNGSFNIEESVRVSHILISAGNGISREEARKKAEDIRETLLRGGDFGDIARRYSDCKSAASGGDLGYIKKGFMPKGFEEVAFSIEPGKISHIVETLFGFHIIRVIERIPAGIAPLESVRELIEGYLKKGLIKDQFAKHIADLKGKANIEILLKD